MEAPTSIKLTRHKSKPSSTATPSPVPSPSQVSPELLQTVQNLQAEIEELRGRGSMTADEKAELTQLKTDLKEAREELRTMQTRGSSVGSTEKRIVNYGTFCTVEE